MTFDELLVQVLDVLQREGRVSYRAPRAADGGESKSPVAAAGQAR